ncbi:hypothetical protein R5R35_000413 [Gryllus longicercus]|uniref:dihydrofolate reductase n=1 Tax=Gryllus longicercus TaxID=2509291 RepID=A0AAN9YZ31_9ORTH
MVLKVKLIVAVSENMGIGSKGQLPWRLKKELKYFSRITQLTSDPTKRNAVVMGRRTWESIPAANRPLVNRCNLVLSSQSLVLPEGVTLHHSLEEALQSLGDDIETAWIIGGSSLYQAALEKGLCDQLYVTRILRSYDCDVFLPEMGPGYVLARDPAVPEELQVEDGISYKFEVYEKIKN